MPLQVTTKNQAINDLKLDYIIDKLASDDDPGSHYRGLSREVASDLVELYKAFLYLSYKYNCVGKPLAPTREVDEVWHIHILHTERYMEDCQDIFGHYLQHTPRFGVEELHEYTRILFAAEFPQLAMRFINNAG